MAWDAISQEVLMYNNEMPVNGFKLFNSQVLEVSFPLGWEGNMLYLKNIRMGGYICNNLVVFMES